MGCGAFAAWVQPDLEETSGELFLFVGRIIMGNHTATMDVNAVLEYLDALLPAW